MLRFSLFGFPVTVQPGFWILSALLGLGGGGENALLQVLFWVAICFLSILWHELGHTFAFRRFGIRSEIVLHSFGGYAIPPPGSRLTRRQDLIVSAAGPAFQLLIGVPLWWMNREGMLYEFASERPFAWMILWMLMWINLGWALINLLPVVPLDGGRISLALFGPRREKAALWLSVAAAGTVAVLFLSNGMLFGGLLFGMLAYNNWQRLHGGDEVNW